ncbi:hypothetical protein M432DRAFT_612413 [Thermoascus aurantiacus ATCC 26904]
MGSRCVKQNLALVNSSNPGMMSLDESAPLLVAHQVAVRFALVRIHLNGIRCAVLDEAIHVELHRRNLRLRKCIETVTPRKESPQTNGLVVHQRGPDATAIETDLGTATSLDDRSARLAILRSIGDKGVARAETDRVGGLVGLAAHAADKVVGLAACAEAVALVVLGGKEDGESGHGCSGQEEGDEHGGSLHDAVAVHCMSLL